MKISILSCYMLFLSLCKFSYAMLELYVCESADPSFLGKYILDKNVLQDSVPTFTNENDRSFFRNKGFWYLGSLANWPPDTYFRCVDGEGCTMNEESPSVSGYSINKKYESKGLTVPAISLTKCPTDEL